MKKNCSKCGKENDRLSQRYCKACHAEYMRAHRPKYRDLTAEQKKKANARSYAHVYRDRGVIEKSPCLKCGSADSQMHHDDYDKPIDVEWLCRPCHIELHNNEY